MDLVSYRVAYRCAQIHIVSPQNSPIHFVLLSKNPRFARAPFRQRNKNNTRGVIPRKERRENQSTGFLRIYWNAFIPVEGNLFQHVSSLCQDCQHRSCQHRTLLRAGDALDDFSLCISQAPCRNEMQQPCYNSVSNSPSSFSGWAAIFILLFFVIPSGRGYLVPAWGTNTIKITVASRFGRATLFYCLTGGKWADNATMASGGWGAVFRRTQGYSFGPCILLTYYPQSKVPIFLFILFLFLLGSLFINCSTHRVNNKLRFQAGETLVTCPPKKNH